MKKGKRMVAWMLALTILAGGLEWNFGKTPVTTEAVPVTLASAAASQTTVSTATTTGTAVTTGNTQLTQTGTTQAVTTQKETTQEQGERKAVWISYIDLGSNSKQKKKTRAQFVSMITKMFDNVKKMGMNTVVVHVRANSDALYESSYYPWSAIVSGKQGKNPGYDPLEIMVEEAHARGLFLEAWINPYRVTTNSTSIRKLAKDNPARKWYSNSATRRNVLIYNGQIYYNPAKAQVRQLIVDGVKEIVANYDVDAIHFDDYFYPTFSRFNYNHAFDTKEYQAYVKSQKSQGNTPKSIANWRRNNVNLLVKEVYRAVKEEKNDVEFGISPAGNIQNLRSKYSYYVDIDRWLTHTGYVDYICPQIYWGFKNGQYSYDKVLKSWTDANKKGIVKLYVGLAMYRTSEYASFEWRTKKDIMKRSVRYARNTGETDGFYFFSYNSFYKSRAAKEKKNVLAELKKQ